MREGRISPEQMCRVLSENPAKLYGMYAEGMHRRGKHSGSVILDPEKEAVISADTQHYAMDYAPLREQK